MNRPRRTTAQRIALLGIPIAFLLAAAALCWGGRRPPTELETLEREAYAGNARSALVLGLSLAGGEKGSTKNEALGYAWMNVAHTLDPKYRITAREEMLHPAAIVEGQRLAAELWPKVKH